MTTDLVNNIKHAAGGHNAEYTVPSTASLQLVFNESVYPYNLVKVRQALAYLINRTTLQRVAEPVGGSVSKWITGTVDSNAKTYLTAAQLKKLNPYKPDRKKATALLTSAGFKQQGGKWIMPNGKPWTMTLWTVSGFNDVTEAMDTIKSTLDSFGVPTDVQLASSYGQYLQDIKAQKYDVMFWIGTGATPYNMMARLFMAPNGYNVENGQLTRVDPSDHVKGNWLDFPASVKVTGYGTVKAGPLTYSLSQTRDPKKIKRIVQELMIMTNQYVPEITMWNVTQVGFVNDQYFTDYPTKSRLMMQTCFGYYPPIGCWEMRGYVHPK
jgi:peptide/nickel transport system substrate-binding protein